VTDPILVKLREAGLDLVHPFAVLQAWREPGLECLSDPTEGDAQPKLGLLVGNTRGLWPRFAAAIAADPDLAVAADPIDRYAEQIIEPVAAALGGRAWFAHRRYDGRYLPFQRLAVVAGVAALSPSQLLIHPIYGPWFALRAVIVCDGEPPFAAPVTRPCECAAHGCVAAFERASARPDDWHAWVAVRDACPVGREHRYGDPQIAYHYSKDRRFLP
jgi:methylmalonic aciduria homocystinuria type C protein